MIRVTLQDDFELLAKLLNDAFKTVADEYGLTRENCPTNSAFITVDELQRNLNERREFYRLDVDDNPAGFIAIEKSGNQQGVYYIEKVAVHPRYRRQGLGRQLMAFAETRIRELGGEIVSIALIDANARLKTWYKSQGYVETGVRDFEHLPFRVVCFMEKNVKPEDLDDTQGSLRVQ